VSINSKPQINPFYDLSLWFLLFSNIVTIYFAITENWDLSVIVWVYWFQSITIGFFNFIRILQLKEFSTENFQINGHSVQPTEKTKVSSALFFLFHFGFFHFVYFVFLSTGGITFNETSQNTLNFVEVKYIALAVLLFFINHLFSFFYNKPQDTRKQNIGSLMSYPYARIIPMHLTIIFGTMFGGALSLFLTLKTFADIIMHIVEHNVLRKGTDQ